MAYMSQHIATTANGSRKNIHLGRHCTAGQKIRIQLHSIQDTEQQDRSIGSGRPSAERARPQRPEDVSCVSASDSGSSLPPPRQQIGDGVARMPARWACQNARRERVDNLLQTRRLAKTYEAHQRDPKLEQLAISRQDLTHRIADASRAGDGGQDHICFQRFVEAPAELRADVKPQGRERSVGRQRTAERRGCPVAQRDME